MNRSLCVDSGADFIFAAVGRGTGECDACRFPWDVNNRIKKIRQDWQDKNMEREKELVKLINVLRRTSRMALQSEWTGGKEDAAAFCTEQYNRVLARLKELDPGVGVVFESLAASSSLTVVAMASR